MLINLDNYNTLASKGDIVKGKWGGDDDGTRHTACLMSALVPGATNEAACASAGWPLWLAEISVWLFDGFGDDYIERGRELAVAIKAASDRGVDFDRVFRDVRLDSILPIALDSVDAGDEPWRVRCRDVVQWSIDNDGAKAEAADAAAAAGAAGAARAAGADWAARAAEAAGAAWAAAHLRIYKSLLKALAK